MDKYIYDENNGLWYELQGEYYLPIVNEEMEKTDRGKLRKCNLSFLCRD